VLVESVGEPVMGGVRNNASATCCIVRPKKKKKWSGVERPNDGEFITAVAEDFSMNEVRHLKKF